MSSVAASDFRLSLVCARLILALIHYMPNHMLPGRVVAADGALNVLLCELPKDPDVINVSVDKLMLWQPFT